MTIDDEENFIIKQIFSQRERVGTLEKKQRELAADLRRERQRLEDAKQALVDYMIGNGCMESERAYVKYGEAVVVADDAAVPDEFVRIKREPDKRKIAAVRPDANWYKIERKPHVTIKRSA